jgi:hypothetical protein
MKNKSLPPRIYKHLAEVMRRANEASQAVLEENKRLGIPTPFALEGRIYYLMPDGKIVLRRLSGKRALNNRAAMR